MRICAKCQQPSDRKTGYCKACHNLWRKEKRAKLAAVRPEKPRGLCPRCHQSKEPHRLKQVYCLPCSREASRETRNRYPYANWSDEKKLAFSARNVASNYQKILGIPYQPCQLCGNPKTEKHHPDIRVPLEIVWLCRKCHMAAHKSADPSVPNLPRTSLRLSRTNRTKTQRLGSPTT